jgi:hypothetical protein
MRHSVQPRPPTIQPFHSWHNAAVGFLATWFFFPREKIPKDIILLPIIEITPTPELDASITIFNHLTEVNERLHTIGSILLASPYLMQHPNVAITLAVEPSKVIVHLVCGERIDDWPVGYYQTA